MWSIVILEKMYNCLVSGGKLVTYCAQGQFKRDLKAIGFEVVNVPGPPGKREITLNVAKSLRHKLNIDSDIILQ